MLKKLLRKLIVIGIWVGISVTLYQCSVMEQTEEGREATYEEEEKKERTQEQIKEQIKEQIEKQNIRVLIKTSGFSKIYHEEVIMSSEKGLYIEQDQKLVMLAPKEEKVFTKQELCGKRVGIRAHDGGTIRLHNVVRAENISYRGQIECIGTEEGIVVINELPVEEYLYGVVPSEMPSSYPPEALKAQAISARTYTYYHMESFAYPEWLAHVDDSTAFQVYQNIAENEQVNRAVDETKDQVLMHQGKTIESFYYSTSSGRSTGYEVWKTEEKRDWLMGKALTKDFQKQRQMDDFYYDSKTDMEIIDQKEKAYRIFMSLGSTDDVEYEEAWYRWAYTRSFEDIQGFLERVEMLAEKYPEDILICSKYIGKEKLTQESEILSCRITQRAASGMAQQLCIQTQHFEILIGKQQCIREVLAVSGECVIKKDGSTFVLGELLPSAYFYFDCMYEEQNLKSMTIYGGGFGHGAGMSQNGAKRLANMGLAAEDILKYYYTDIEIARRDAF